MSNDYQNSEGYPDPTAGEALSRIAENEKQSLRAFRPIVYINGWYYYDGRPALYVRNKDTYTDGEQWGHRMVSMYKTYAYQEFFYSYYGYHFRKELYLYTPYLATINNLSTPVIKTADKTMKVTYTLTETEEA